MADVSPSQMKSFVQRFLPVAQQLEQKYGIPAYAILTQAAHESRFGTSSFATERNNLGGIGAVDSNPNAAYTFKSPEDSLDFMARVQMAKAQRPENQWLNTRYAPSAAVLADRSNGPEQVFGAMQDSKWASDPNYAKSLLTRYQQIQPFLGTAKPTMTKQAMIQPQATSTKIPGFVDGQVRITSPKPVTTPAPITRTPDQTIQDQRNRDASHLAMNQPGYTPSQSPPSTIDLGAIGGFLGNLLGGRK